MKSSAHWNSFLAEVNRRSEEFFSDTQRTVTVTGIVLAPTRIAGTGQLLSNIPDWHAASGNLFDFYWPGHSFHVNRIAKPVDRAANLPRNMEAMRAIPINEEIYYDKIDDFSESAFRDFVRDMEGQFRQEAKRPRQVPRSRIGSGSHYSGEISLLLLDTRYNPMRERTNLVLDSAVMLHMSQIERMSSIVTANSLFEAIRRSLSESPQVDQDIRRVYRQLNLGNLGVTYTQTGIVVVSALMSVAGLLSSIMK